MSDQSRLEWVFVLNAGVLLTHEIDSAYWHEWELFGIPGGIQLFVAINLVLVIAVLVGLRLLVRQRPSGIVFSWLLAGSGFVATGLHSSFLLRGDDSFRLPASLALLAATAILSTMQAFLLLRRRRVG